MNIALAFAFARTARQLRRACTAALITLAGLVAWTASAAPGAHGPSGEHLDGPAQTNAAAINPRIEAKSELFELVAQLKGGELVILVDRYDSNEPVLGARLDVESGSQKATAAFRADQGDYVVTDTAMLKALATPGEHALVFTLVSGTDSDLLDSTLVTAKAATAVAGAAHSQDDGHGHGLQRAAWTGAVLLVLGTIGAIAWLRRRRRDAATPTNRAQ